MEALTQKGYEVTMRVASAPMVVSADPKDTTERAFNEPLPAAK